MMMHDDAFYKTLKSHFIVCCCCCCCLARGLSSCRISPERVTTACLSTAGRTKPTGISPSRTSRTSPLRSWWQPASRGGEKKKLTATSTRFCLPLLWLQGVYRCIRYFVMFLAWAYTVCSMKRKRLHAGLMKTRIAKRSTKVSSEGRALCVNGYHSLPKVRVCASLVLLCFMGNHTVCISSRLCSCFYGVICAAPAIKRPGLGLKLQTCSVMNNK